MANSMILVGRSHKKYVNEARSAATAKAGRSAGGDSGGNGGRGQGKDGGPCGPHRHLYACG